MVSDARAGHVEASKILPADFVFVCTPPLLFFVSFLYSIALVSKVVNHNTLSFLYSLVLIIVGLLNISRLRSRATAVSVQFVLLLVIAVHLGFLLGFGFMNGPSDFLWATDTLNYHLPNAILVSEWLDNGGNIEIFDADPFKTIYLSNMWVGLFFYLFGVSPLVSSLALIPIKLGTVVLIYKATNNFVEDRFVALTAAVLYALMPTVTFYTLQFYKEFFVQFLVALELYIVSECIKRPGMIVMALIPLAALFVDRFYLSIMLIVGLCAYYFRSAKRLYSTLLITLIAAVGITGILGYYFGGQGVAELMSTIREFQEVHNEGEDVTPTINIWVDLFRIIFTPFFTFRKVDEYSGFDSLIIFGSVLHQIVMIFYFIGLVRMRKSGFALLNISFGMLLVLFAIIAPYSGRERDSFYPLIVMFASIGIATSFANRFYANGRLLTRGSMRDLSRVVQAQASLSQVRTER